MRWLIDIITNPFLITSLASWFVAQLMKTIIYAIINKKIDLRWMFSDGAMPSAHSATVCSLAAISGLVSGFNSFPFACTTILAVIVCHDAMGVRRETGKQAVVLNELIKAFDVLGAENLPEDVKLKEFVGHTPVQVLAGILVGVVNAFLMYWILY